MNKKEILKKVGGILTELNEQYEYLSQRPDNLNELELELFSANANFLSDHLSILVKLNDAEAKNAGTVNTESPKSEKLPEREETVAEPEEVAAEPEEPVAEPEETVTEPEPTHHEEKEETVSDWKFELDKEPGLNFDFEEKPADKLFDRPLTDEEKRVIDEKTRLKSVDKEEEEEEEYIDFEEETNEEIEEVQVEEVEETEDDVHVKEVVISERTIAVPAEAIPDEKPIPTVNDLLSKSLSQQTVASQFNSRQSKDLKGMISLNDKLLFVRDLFNGYSLAYSEALELLNRFDNFEAADNFLKQNYAPKNHWADKQDVADKFYEILNRRFSK